MTDEISNYRDMAKAADAKTRDTARDDLQHEIAGRETGRQQRFLTGKFAEQAAEQRKRERTRFVSELARMLADPAYAARYQAFGDMLTYAETEAALALFAAEADLTAARDALEDTEDRANRLPDGTKVFRTADGRVVDADGNSVSDADAAGIVWMDDAPGYDAYVAAKARVAAAQKRADDIRHYQTDVLGHARDRWQDQDDPITQTEMDELQNRMNEAFSREEPSANRQEADGDADLGRTSMPTALPKLSE